MTSHSQSGLHCRIYINKFENCTPLCHFTNQTAQATLSKFGLGVLYSIAMKMGIIKNVLIKAFIIKKNFFSYTRFAFYRVVSF